MAAAPTDSNQREAALTTAGGLACPVCRATTQKQITLEDFALFHCAACNCWSSDALARGATTSFEPASYFLNPNADEPRWRGLLNRRAASGLATRTALDVGCGNGAYLEWLRERQPDIAITGIELDKSRARQAHDSLTDAHIITADAARGAASLDEKFDLITLWDVFEHVPDPRSLVEILSQRLHPGGWLFLQTINEFSLLPTLGRLSYRLTGGAMTSLARRTHEAHHVTFFSRDGLERLLSDNSLRVGELWYGRLARDRMDGNPIVTAVAGSLMAVENLLGNGVFINVIAERDAPANQD